MKLRYYSLLAIISVVGILVGYFINPIIAYFFGAYLLFYAIFQFYSDSPRFHRLAKHDIVNIPEFTSRSRYNS